MVGARLKSVPLTKDLIRRYVPAWIGTLVNPENPGMTATIAALRAESVTLKLPNGHLHSVSFREIIDADSVIRHCLAKDRAPRKADFRDPDPAIGARRIHNHSYAPALAERVRRRMLGGGRSEANPSAFRLPDEIPSGLAYSEGSASRVEVNRYERDPQSRLACIKAHGTDCWICGFRFGAVYGPEAEGYIHVHHIRPLSEVGGEYVVDPVKDLRPVCPNCHAVLHLDGRCRSLEELRQMLATQRRADPGMTPDRAGRERVSSGTASPL
jgi:hypothetical protein